PHRMGEGEKRVSARQGCTATFLFRFHRKLRRQLLATSEACWATTHSVGMWHFLVSCWCRGHFALALVRKGGGVETLETYGHFTSNSARSLTGKIGTRPPSLARTGPPTHYQVSQWTIVS